MHRRLVTLSKALELFEKSAELSKNTRNILGCFKAASRLNPENKVFSEFRRIGSIQGKFALVYHLLRKNQPEKALGIINGILKVNPNNIWCYFYRGVIKVLLDAENLAILDFDRSLRFIKSKTSFKSEDVGLIHYNKAITMR